MNLTSVHVDDIVQCDVKGRVFFALVREKQRGGLRVFPITAGITHRTVTAKQVVAHFRRSKQSRSRGTREEVTVFE